MLVPIPRGFVEELFVNKRKQGAAAIGSEQHSHERLKRRVPALPSPIEGDDFAVFTVIFAPKGGQLEPA